MNQVNVTSGSMSNAATIQSYQARYGNGIRIEPRMPVRQRPAFAVRNCDGAFPSHLGEPATIKLIPDHRYLRGIEFSFASAAEALIALDSYQFQVAALWLSLDLLGPNEVDAFIEAFIDDAQFESVGDLTYHETAAMISKKYGARTAGKIRMFS